MFGFWKNTPLLMESCARLTSCISPCPRCCRDAALSASCPPQRGIPKKMRSVQFLPSQPRQEGSTIVHTKAEPLPTGLRSLRWLLGDRRYELQRQNVYRHAEVFEGSFEKCSLYNVIPL